MTAEGFEWDESKNRQNISKHHIDFQAAKNVFAGPTVERIDRRFDYSEMRIICLGAVEGTEMVVVYTWRGTVRRLISARRAHEKERHIYRRAFPKGRAS
jgi:uncharacterized DUF497 family protein